MYWAADYARRRNYKYWKAFTTGKPPSLGGVPHDMFGMTTRSVHAYVLGCLRKSGLAEENVTKFQTGGPDGDLGSNEILISKDRTKAIVDGSGVVYDPNGLDRVELTRLAKKRAMVHEFDRSKLSKGGFLVLIGDRDVKLPSGEFIESGLKFRNEFHLHPLSSADVFVPCGGRPESINLSNVDKMFDEKGLPRFKFIVEGANLFLTNDARMILEKAGVVLYKDASANKGGVTSSSFEVLAALAMSDAEHQKHMCVQGKEFPQFYTEYVKEIQDIIQKNAEMEFECIWREHELSGKPRFILTEEVSAKINSLNTTIKASTLWDRVDLRKKVMSEALPKTLTKMIGVDTAMERIPEAYMRAIFGSYLASNFVYKYGISSSEFAFFEFMQGYLGK
jgi:glutamate dehydrogenase